jgi:hypothetical protein
MQLQVLFGADSTQSPFLAICGTWPQPADTGAIWNSEKNFGRDQPTPQKFRNCFCVRQVVQKVVFRLRAMGKSGVPWAERI